MNDIFKESAEGLTESEFLAAKDPFDLFSSWFAEAAKSEPSDPNAMAMATVDSQGMPNVRIVLLKEFSPKGLVFYTNLESRKGEELSANPRVALVLYWKSLNRQIRVRGLAEAVSAEEADVYFASRPHEAQIGAWASRQSRSMETSQSLKDRIVEMEKLYIGEVPRPQHWGGFRVIPLEIEFWANRPFRLHDRLVFRRREPGASWASSQLYP